MSTTATTTRPAQDRDRKHTAVWTAQIVLAAVFLFAAVPKLAGVHTSVRMFAQMGAGQWLRYFVGTAELAGAVGLLVPKLAGLAAAGLAADMVGASIINVVVLHSDVVALTIALCVACVLVARNHWAQRETRAASSDDDPCPAMEAAVRRWPYSENHSIKHRDTNPENLYIRTLP